MGAFNELGGFSFETSGGLKEMVVSRAGVSNAQLYISTGGAFSAIGSANLDNSAQINFVQASDRLFGFNGVEVVDVASDGTTVTRNRAGVPKGAFGFWFHNFLFVGGVTATPNRLFWSNLGDPTTFDAANYVDINANDGDSITALNILNDELIVFKHSSVWSISGWSGSTFSATTIAGQNTQNKASGNGTPSHQSVISLGRDLYYLSFSGGIPHFRSFTQTSFAKTIEGGIVSLDIETTMTGLNKSQLSKCTGIYDGRYIYWALCNGASTTNNLVVVTDPDKTFNTTLGKMNSWVTWTGIAPQQFFSSTLSGVAKIYFTDGSTGGLVFLIDSSLHTDNGTNVVMTILTRDFMLHPARQAKWVYAYQKYLSGSSGTLLIYARVDQSTDFSLQKTLNLQGTSPGLGPTGSFTLGTSTLGGAMISQTRITFQGMVGQMVGLKYTESTSGACTLYDMDILGFLKGYRATRT